MNVSRRKLLNAGGAIVLAGLIPGEAGSAPGAGAPRPGPAPGAAPDALAGLTSARFRRQVNTPFAVLGLGTAVRLRLIDVVDQTPESAGAGQESFSLVFAGRWDQPLPQGTYRLAHARLGQFHLFLVPGSVAADGNHYQAVINRVL